MAEVALLTPGGVTDVDKDVSQERFEQIIEIITRHIREIHKHIHAVAEHLGELSRQQLAEAKKRLVGFLSGEHLERLWMFSRGIMPQYLAEQVESIPPSVWRSLPDEAKQRLIDPMAPIQMAGVHGKETVFAKNVTAKQWKRVLDSELGIMTFEQQLKSFEEKLKRSSRARTSEISTADRFSRIVPCPNKPGYAIMVGESPDGFSRDASRIEFPINALLAELNASLKT